MDRHARELEREASQGDIQDQARLLLARIRSGVLTRERVALASYAGHEPARLIQERNGYACCVCRAPGEAGAYLAGPAYCGACALERELDRWTMGLACWGQDALNQASVHAGIAALSGWERTRDGHCPVRYVGLGCECRECLPGQVLNTAARYLRRPSRELAYEWMDRYAATGWPGVGFVTGSPTAVPEHHVGVIRNAVQVGPGWVVKRVMTEALIEWALGGASE